MGRRVVNREALKRSVARSAEASARIEGRVVPKGYVRSERVERFLAERRQRA